MLQMGGIAGPENLEGSNRKRDLSAIGPQRPLPHSQQHTLSLAHTHTHTLLLFPALSHTLSLCLGVSQSLILRRSPVSSLHGGVQREVIQLPCWLAGWLTLARLGQTEAELGT